MVYEKAHVLPCSGVSKSYSFIAPSVSLIFIEDCIVVFLQSWHNKRLERLIFISHHFQLHENLNDMYKCEALS